MSTAHEYGKVKHLGLFLSYVQNFNHHRWFDYVTGYTHTITEGLRESFALLMDTKW